MPARPRDLDRDAGPGLRLGGAGRGDRRLPARAAGGEGAAAAGASTSERVRAAARPRPKRLWRGPAYSEVRDEPFARAEARRLEELLLVGHRDEDRRGADPRPARGRDRRAGGVDQRQPHARAAVVPAHAGALPLGPPGRGAAGVPGPADHPGGRVGDRARARRDLDGARHPRPGPRARLPGPARARIGRVAGRTRRRRPHGPATRSGCPASRREGPLVGRDREIALLTRLVGVGGPRCGAPAPGRRRPGHRQDAAGGRTGARRSRRDGASGAVGPLRRGPRGAVPAFRRGARAVLPVALGGPDLAHARLAAHRALPAGPAPARVRAAARGRGRRPGQRAVPVLRSGDGDVQRARPPAAPSSW